MPTEIAKVLNSEEISVAQAQGDKIAASANKVVSDETFVFFAAFEGTNNTGRRPSHSCPCALFGALKNSFQ